MKVSCAGQEGETRDTLAAQYRNRVGHDMNKRQQMAYETKMKIVNAGLELLRQQDWDSVTVSDVTRAAGVTRTNFYAYFKGKDDIVGFVLADLDGEYLKFYENTLRGDALSPLCKLELLLKESNRIMTGPGAALLRYYYIRMLRAPKQPLVKRNYDGILRALIAECRQKGLLNATYTDEDIFGACLALNRGVCMEWALRDGDSPIQAWDAMLHSFCMSISA